jgi:uncharacterized YigZ family protein
MIDRYKTIESPGGSVYRELSSRFIGFAFHASNETAFQSELHRITREHHASRHVCYAYRLGADGSKERSSDAGEPSGTAGMPIIRAIRGSQFTNIGVIVVRYFGGTLLGTAGLIRAYGEAARTALADARIVERIVIGRLGYDCTYAQYERIKQEVVGIGGTLEECAFSDRCTGIVGVPKGNMEELILRWQVQGIRTRRIHQPK